MQTNTKPERNKTDWLRLTALAGLSALAIFAFYQDAQAGPVTGGPNNPPYVKLGVYQGVLSIVPGDTGDSVMEIGNDGRDIGSTGAINIRPDAATVTAASNYARFSDTGGGQTGLALTGSLCLEGSCLDVWADICTRVPAACSGGLSGAANKLPKFNTTGNGLVDSAVFENGGNVGIGTTTTTTGKLSIVAASNTASIGESVLYSDSYNNPGIRFGRSGYGSVFGFLNDGDTVGAGSYATVLGMNSFYACDVVSPPPTCVGRWYTANGWIMPTAIKLGSGYISFSTQTSHQNGIQGTYTPTERMRITSAGNVGIGTNNPQDKLDVAGNIRIGANNVYGRYDVNGTVIRTTRTDNTQQGLFGSNGWGDFTFDRSVGIGYQLSGASAGAGNLFVSGKIGVNNTTPAAKIVVNNNLAANGSAGDGVFITVDSLNSALYAKQQNVSLTAWAGYFVGGVNVEGRLCLGGTCITQWSDVGGGGVGPGTVNKLAKFTGTGATVGDSAIYENGGNVGIGNSAPVAKVVINDGVANNGNANDTLSIYSNKSSSALYVEQGNVSGFGGYFTQNTAGNSSSALFAQNTSSTGYAAYFAGAINVESNIFIGGSAVLKGIAKTSWPTQVCLVNGGACLGRYLGTVGTTTADLQFRYNNSSNQPTLTGLIYSSVPDSCAAGWSPLARSTGTNSQFSALSCTQFVNEYAVGGSGGYGSGLVCSEDAETEIMISRVLSSSGCATITSVLRTRLHQLEARFTAITLQYELR